MKAQSKPGSINGSIDTLFEDIEALRQRLTDWELLGCPRALVNTDPKRGSIFEGELTHQRIIEKQQELEGLRLVRRSKIANLSTLKKTYRGKSVNAIIKIAETRLNTIDIEILKWKNEIVRLEGEFSETVLQGRSPNYAFAHIANVGLALEEDTRAVAAEEFRIILDYRTGRGRWPSRLALYLRKKFAFTPFYKQGI